MTIRVAHFGTGNVGRLALIELITDPQFELTAVWVSSEPKVGKDAGELAGLDIVTGIAATDDMESVLATSPECAVYCPMGDTRPREALADCRRILEAGINVVGSAPVVLQYPWNNMSEKTITRVEEAAHRGGVSPGTPLHARVEQLIAPKRFTKTEIASRTVNNLSQFWT